MDELAPRHRIGERNRDAAPERRTGAEDLVERRPVDRGEQIEVGEPPVEPGIVRRDVGHAKDMAMKLGHEGREVREGSRSSLRSVHADAKGVACLPGNLERVRDEEERQDRDLDGRNEMPVRNERTDVERTRRSEGILRDS